MKDLTKILSKGNLTPRERALLIIKNDAHFIKTGKHLLAEADLVALTKTWKPDNYREAEQYNKYIDLWDMYLKLEIDMQTCYLTTQLTLSRLEHIATLFYYRKDDPKRHHYDLRTFITDEQDAEFRTFFLQHSGYEYDRLVHLQTFYSLPKHIQQDVLLLDPSVTSDHSYFWAEEQIARVVDNKKDLSDTDIDLLTKTIIDSIPWGQEFNLLEVKISVKQVIFNLHFGSYPLLNFGKRLASRCNIHYDSEDELRNKLAELDDLKYKLENVVRDTIKDGSFFDECTPLCKSDGYLTHEGTTTLSHDRIMKLWLDAKDLAVQSFECHITSGNLATCECPIRFFEVSLNKTYITGESLYKTDLALPFVNDYLKQIDEMSLYSYPTFLIHKSNAFDNYQHLLAFKDATIKLSEIIGVNLSDNVSSHLKVIIESTNTLNFYLREMSEHILGIKDDTKVKYRLQTFLPDPIIALHNLAPKQNESLKVFQGKLSRVLE
jgi:hypothetical protein